MAKYEEFAMPCGCRVARPRLYPARCEVHDENGVVSLVPLASSLRWLAVLVEIAGEPYKIITKGCMCHDGIIRADYTRHGKKVSVFIGEDGCSIHAEGYDFSESGTWARIKAAIAGEAGG